MMELRKGAALARAVGLNNCEAALPYLELTASAAHGLPPLFYVLAPGGGGTLRKWPAGQFSRLAERIFARTGWTGMICGGVEDDGCALRITELEQGAVNQSQPAHYRCPNWPVHCPALNWYWVMTPASFTWRRRSVPQPYVFSAAGIPEDSCRTTWIPLSLRPAPKAVIHKLDCFGCDWKCVHKPAPGTPAPCVANVSVEAVWAEVQAIIESREGAGAPIDRCAQLDDDRTQWPLKNRGD